MSRRLVAGVDSSTQSTKVVVRNADTGELVREGRAPHPPGTEVDPAAWWQALQAATEGGLLHGVDAIAVGAQQHGTVLLDEAWMGTETGTHRSPKEARLSQERTPRTSTSTARGRTS